ncbi:MAG: FimB/Mfa2 family fimbrial subunit [Tannerella sp.]|jgi:hypothetical protein|nr:FimB/Mfa2 family fimbrial subunit [Tannerella sp.]
MGCIKKIGLLICGIVLITQSCVRNNLEDCPPSVRYAISFEYLLHTFVDPRGVPVNRFENDVEKMYIYVFDDATGLCILADTTQRGPFTNDLLYYLPFSGGTYDIIVWGWGENPFSPQLDRRTGVLPRIPIEVGKTTIDEAKFVLFELNNNVNNMVDGKIEKTFYGEIPDKYIPPFISDVDTVSLRNITKAIRVIIPDIENASTEIPDWKNNLKITIEGDNAAYKIGKTGGLHATEIDGTLGSVIYNPYQTLYTDSVLVNDPIYTNHFDGSRTTGLVVDISTLRLVEHDTNMKVVLTWTLGTEVKRLELPLLELLERHPAFIWSGNLQRYLDVEDRWEIIFRITDTHVSVATEVMQWHIVKQDVGIGGILQ